MHPHDISRLPVFRWSLIEGNEEREPKATKNETCAYHCHVGALFTITMEQPVPFPGSMDSKCRDTREIR
jgi:hypothetical protein